jgi:hypothetical protein
MLLALALPIGLLAGVLIGLILAGVCYVRVMWALGKLLGYATSSLATRPRRAHWSLRESPVAPPVLALPPRR